MKYRPLITIFISVLIVVVLLFLRQKGNEIRIGVITPLSGDSAYWGESTRVGVRMASSELATQGIRASFVVEDGKLDPQTALNAAQKLVAVDRVQAIYSEFNPASIAVSSFLKGNSQIFHLYDSAAVSPLDQGLYNFKTYLDYEIACKDVARYAYLSRGIVKIGVLKMNVEFGSLCLAGIKEIYGDKIIVESYNPGTSDFRSLLTKLKDSGVDAVFNGSFQAETLQSIRAMHDLHMQVPFIGLSETITPNVIPEIGSLIEGDIFFGLPRISLALLDKIRAANGGRDVADYNAAALAYVHLVQLAKAEAGCSGKPACVGGELAGLPADEDIGFEGFSGRKAIFRDQINEWSDGKFTPVSSQVYK